MSTRIKQADWKSLDAPIADVIRACVEVQAQIQLLRRAASGGARPLTTAQQLAKKN